MFEYAYNRHSAELMCVYPVDMKRPHMVLSRSSSSLVVHVVLSSRTSAATRMMPYLAPCELAPLGSAALSSLKCAGLTWSISTSCPSGRRINMRASRGIPRNASASLAMVKPPFMTATILKYCSCFVLTSRGGQELRHRADRAGVVGSILKALIEPERAGSRRLLENQARSAIIKAGDRAMPKDARPEFIESTAGEVAAELARRGIRA